MNPAGIPSEPSIPLTSDGPVAGIDLQELKARFQTLDGHARLNDEQVEIVYGIAHAMFQQGKLDSALGLLEVLVAYRPTDARIMFAYAICCKKMLRFESAIPSFMAAFFLDPQDLAPVVHLSECLAAIGEKKASTTVLEPLLEITKIDQKYDSLRNRVQLLRDMLSRH